jgi:hypothetical protein
MTRKRVDLAPLDRPLDAGTWIEFAVGLVVFAVIVRERSLRPMSPICA